jgi:purine-nucleoside phosphorylase
VVHGFAIEVPPPLDKLGPIEVALILGSGFSALADAVEWAQVVPFDEIEGFPLPERQVVGHAGNLVIGSLGGKHVGIFQGRIHCYQGFSATEVAFPVRLAHAMGARTLIATNAAGSVTAVRRPGDLVLIGDHINLACANPLTGWPGPDGGSPFVPMRDAYDPELRVLALEAAAEQDVPLSDSGVYAWLLGPNYETPAEVAMLGTLGADLVGMSTVPEVIAARALGMRVLALSHVTNVAAGAGLEHSEVLEMGRLATDRVHRLTLAILQRLR